MGRDPKNERREAHYTKLVRNVMQTDAWRALSPVAQALYPWLRLEWHGPKNNNNGRIWLSVRQAADRMGVSRNTAARAFHDLQAKGFLVLSEAACLGLYGSAKASTFELTEIELPNKPETSGRRLYKDWRPGKDFPVSKLRANNPEGKNGKSFPHHQSEDKPSKLR